MPTKQDCILDYAQTAGRRQYTRLIQEHLAQTYDAPPLALLLVLVAIPGVIILGVLLALVQRIREIQKGEEDDAKNY